MTGQVMRARGLLARGGWLDVACSGSTYPLRLGGDRRSRAAMSLDEATFRELIAEPGLKARQGGGWIARARSDDDTGPPFGSPGRIDGTRHVMQPDGSMTRHAANLGESPIAWLARRRDANGNPWLSPTEVAAGERLRRDFQMAMSGPSMTMRWDALPRARAGSAGPGQPGDMSLAAGRRAALALDQLSPRARSLVQQVCILESSLQMAEREAGFQRRQGKTVLKTALQTLADFYRIG